jgi:predicted nucleotidyltransferase
MLQSGDAMTTKRVAIDLPMDRIREFCERWKITEFGLFGSVVREDFRPDSDVDVLVAFADDARWDLFDLMHMKDELEAMFGREVDLVQKKGLKNPYRRESILGDLVVVHAA